MHSTADEFGRARAAFPWHLLFAKCSPQQLVWHARRLARAMAAMAAPRPDACAGGSLRPPAWPGVPRPQCIEISDMIASPDNNGAFLYGIFQRHKGDLQQLIKAIAGASAKIVEQHSDPLGYYV